MSNYFCSIQKLYYIPVRICSCIPSWLHCNTTLLSSCFLCNLDLKTLTFYCEKQLHCLYANYTLNERLIQLIWINLACIHVLYFDTGFDYIFIRWAILFRINLPKQEIVLSEKDFPWIQFTHNWKCCPHLLILHLFNTKQDMLKNVGKPLIVSFVTMSAAAGLQHSSFVWNPEKIIRVQVNSEEKYIFLMNHHFNVT